MNFHFPKGGVIESTLFLIYMNKLPMILHYHSFTKFANDIYSFCPAKNLNEASSNKCQRKL